MNTFSSEHYTITTSIGDHSIIVHVVNNISYVGYEGNFNPRAIGISFGLADTFTLINKCFTEVGSSKVEIELIQNTGAEHLMVKFYYMVDGILETHFIVRLAEKRVAAGDTGLIVEMNRQKQMIADLTGTVDKMRAEMERQKQFIVELMNRMEVMNNDLSNKLENPDLASPIEDRVAKLETTTKVLSTKSDQRKVKFEQKLADVVSNTDLRFAKLENEWSDVIAGIDSKTAHFGHAEIELMQVQSSNPFGGGLGGLHVPLNIQSLTLDGSRVRTANGHTHECLQKLKFLYQLETLCIQNWVDKDSFKYLSNDSVSSLTMMNCSEHEFGDIIRKFPNLKELTMCGCALPHDLIEILTSIKHNIKKFVVYGTGNLLNFYHQCEIDAYCKQTGIEFCLH